MHAQTFAFRPGQGELISEGGQLKFNRWRPTNIKRVEGDIAPFLEFAEYLLPIESDRREVMRWFTTLIAHPEVRMLYALLLVSETQGTGKDTLATIARLLVGSNNTSNPGAQEVIESGFHDWLIENLSLLLARFTKGIALQLIAN